MAGAAARAAEHSSLWAALRCRGIRVTAVFVLRGGPDAQPPPAGAVPLAVPPGPVDRENLFLQVERELIERVAGPMRDRLEVLHRRMGSSLADRARIIDARLAGSGGEGSIVPGGPMDVSCFLSERLSAARWNIGEPAPQQVIR